MIVDLQMPQTKMRVELKVLEYRKYRINLYRNTADIHYI